MQGFLNMKRMDGVLVGARPSRSALGRFPSAFGTREVCANELRTVTGINNVQLDADCIVNADKWPKKKNGNPVWEHSDFKNVAYFFVYKLFDRLVGKKSN